MVKADLARVVYERHGGITYQEAQAIVELILREIKSRLLSGENVKLTGFGSLNVIQRLGRQGRNPHTGEQIELAPKRSISFRPSRQFQIDPK